MPQLYAVAEPSTSALADLPNGFLSDNSVARTMELHGILELRPDNRLMVRSRAGVSHGHASAHLGSSHRVGKTIGMEPVTSDEIILKYADDYTTVFESMLDAVRRLGKADKPNRSEGILTGTLTAGLPFTWSEMRVVIHVIRAIESTEVRIHVSSAQLPPGEAQRLHEALKVAARFVLGMKNLSPLSDG